MKRGEAPGRRRERRLEPDPIRTVGGVLVAACSITAMLLSAPPRQRPRSGFAAPGSLVHPAPSAAASVARPSPASPSGPLPLTFETLGAFEPRNVPASILALDGKVVRIDGNVMPMKMNGRHLAAFMLTSFVPDCCFGQEPRINDWVMVGVPAELALSPENLDYAVVTGRLVVKPVKDSSGELIGLFALHATSVTPSESPAKP